MHPWLTRIIFLLLSARLIRTRSPNSALKGLRQWLLRVLPAQTEAAENKLTSARGAFFLFLTMKDGCSVYGGTGDSKMHPLEGRSRKICVFRRADPRPLSLYTASICQNRIC